MLMNLTLLLTQLARLRRDSFDGVSENLVTRIIRLCVGAGVVTGRIYQCILSYRLTTSLAIVAILDGTLYLVYAHNNYHTTPAAILGKLYCELHYIIHVCLPTRTQSTLSSYSSIAGAVKLRTMEEIVISCGIH